MNLANLDLLIPQQPPASPSYSWGTVTHADPVKVRVDGFDDANAIYVTDTLAPVHVGSRVYLQFRGSRVVIMGTSPAAGGVSAGTGVTVTAGAVVLSDAELTPNSEGTWTVQVATGATVPCVGWVHVAGSRPLTMFACEVTSNSVSVFGLDGVTARVCGKVDYI